MDKIIKVWESVQWLINVMTQLIYSLVDQFILSGDTGGEFYDARYYIHEHDRFKI